MSEEIHLFSLVDSAGVEHKVFYWGKYGVTCPTLATTNGSYRFLVYCVHDRFEVKPAEIAPPDSSEWDCWTPSGRGLNRKLAANTSD